jgi:hypothetical protein
MNLVETGYGQHGMRTGLKWKTGPVPPEKACQLFCVIPREFCLLTILHAGISFDAPWFIDQNLIPLIEKFFPMGGMSDKENW